jgi:transposase-like protein
MPRTRKSHPPSLKAKVAVEAIKAHKTAAQIAQMFGVLEAMTMWRNDHLKGMTRCSGRGFRFLLSCSGTDVSNGFFAL